MRTLPLYYSRLGRETRMQLFKWSPVSIISEMIVYLLTLATKWNAKVRDRTRTYVKTEVSKSFNIVITHTERKKYRRLLFVVTKDTYLNKQLSCTHTILCGLANMKWWNGTDSALRQVKLSKPLRLYKNHKCPIFQKCVHLFRTLFLFVFCIPFIDSYLVNINWLPIVINLILFPYCTFYVNNVCTYDILKMIEYLQYW